MQHYSPGVVLLRGGANPQTQSRYGFYLFVLSLAFAPVSVATRMYTQNWSALPESPTAFIFLFTFLPSVPLSPTVLHSHV